MRLAMSLPTSTEVDRRQVDEPENAVDRALRDRPEPCMALME
jgi:hypothetical protein